MKTQRQHIAIFIALLFHISGLIGILLTPYKNWFIQNTPLNLVLMALLLAWNQKGKWRSFFIFFAIAGITGFIAEVIGVQTGALFGNYQYGNMLGPEYAGVPLLIGLNWFVVIFCSGCIVNQLQDWMQQRIGKDALLSPRMAGLSLILDGALLAVLFDWVMEPVAMKLGFWNWKDATVPVYNYLCWIVISMLLLLVFRFFSFGRSNHFAVHLFIIELLFFLVLRIYL